MFCKETDDSLQNMLVKLTHLYFKRAFAALKETDIHPKQVPLLGLLSTQEGQSQREISQALKISAPTVAVSIKRLEKSGILERRADEKDQRMSRIYLTEKGKAITEKVKSCIEESENMTFQGFSESELCLLRRFFAQMIDNLENDQIKE